MLRYIACCSVLIGAMAVGADVLIDDFENAGPTDKAHWTSIGEAINASAPAQYVSYWFFFDDSINGGKSHMEPKLVKDTGSAASFVLCQKAGDGVNGSKGFHQKWYLDGNSGKWAYPYLALGFGYRESGRLIDMTNLTAISLYAKGTPGKKFQFTIETDIPNTSFAGTLTLTDAWTKHEMQPSSFAPSKSGVTWNVAKTKTKASHIQYNGAPGDSVEFWFDSLVFKGMSIDAFLNAVPVKHPTAMTPAVANNRSITLRGIAPEISFNLRKSEQVNVSLFDLTGAMAATMFNGALGAGKHDIAVDRSRLDGSGTYIVRLKNGSVTSTGVLILK